MIINNCPTRTSLIDDRSIDGMEAMSRKNDVTKENPDFG